jgi:hypothetical protein
MTNGPFDKLVGLLRWATGDLAGLYRWLIDRPSYMLLTAGESRLAAAEPSRFVFAWFGLALQSVVWGVVLVCAWNLSWGLFGDVPVARIAALTPSLQVMPALAAAAVFVLWPFRRAAASCAQTLGGADVGVRATVAAIQVVLLTIGLIAMKSRQVYEGQEPPQFLGVRPELDACRALMLMPLWGVWGVLITSQFCKACSDTEGPVAAFARGCGPATASFCVALPLGATWYCFQFLGMWQHWAMSISAGVAAVAAGAIFCRLGGGLSRRALLATSMMTQLAFMLAVLAATKT